MQRSVALVISDVDGTLLTPDKRLTPASVAAVGALRARGIGFAVTSSRPPLGMAMLEGPLELVTPLAGFNGGLFLRPRSHEPILSVPLEDAAVAQVLGVLSEFGLAPWIFTERHWLVLDARGPHVDREAAGIGLVPEQVASFEGRTEPVLKITGVSDDHQAVAEAESTLELAPCSARRSQAYYLDITSSKANKGLVVTRLSEWLSIPASRIAVIGDGHNDVAMFQSAGLSIAMGNAAPEVRAHAGQVSDPNDQEGFARAMHRFVLEDA